MGSSWASFIKNKELERMNDKETCTNNVKQVHFLAEEMYNYGIFLCRDSVNRDSVNNHIDLNKFTHPPWSSSTLKSLLLILTQIDFKIPDLSFMKINNVTRLLMSIYYMYKVSLIICYY